MIEELSHKVNQALALHNTLVVTAPPGVGKSTRLPLSLLNTIKDGKILILEPRRLAARQIAERMAFLLHETVGQTVGYRIRFEHKVSNNTRIEVLTEGILTRMLVADPTLEGVSMVIFDEFHERSLITDLALALTRETQQLLRPELKILLMSATIDTTAICQALQSPHIEGHGQMFPVKVIHTAEEADPFNAAELTAHTIRKAHQEEDGDILAFLPGEAEIRKCQELLGTSLGETKICPLYGLLSSQEQKMAIAPSPVGQRKVVLATNIAETSITIEGVKVVVDAGLCRKMTFNAQNSLSRLQTVRISMDMATQRSGRAGRVAPGTCYRLWSLATEHRMDPSRTPEILEADLTPMMLDLAAWGETQVKNLSWITLPPPAHVAKAILLLQLLNALDEQEKITPHGQKLAALPCHPRIAQMLVCAQTTALKALAADIAALLEERDPLAGTGNSADLSLRIATLRKHRRENKGGWERIIQSAEQYRKLAKVEEDNSTVNPFDIGKLIAQAYPERIARQETNGKFAMACGDAAVVENQDILAAHDWISIASLNAQSGRVFLAAPVRIEDLTSLQKERNNISWDSKQGNIIARKEWRLGKLVVSTKPISEDIQEQVLQVICQALQKEGLSMLDFNEKVQHLQRRIALVGTWNPELDLPELDTESLLKRAEEWLPLYLGKSTTTTEMKKINLEEVIWGLLSYEQQLAVDRLAPTHITVPTGSKIHVEYRQGAELPVLRVRLQECFGLVDTPRVNDGKLPVLLELLSPGFKPVQLTQDLKSFWTNTYFEVRKELRRRYPKHFWPDNPLEAEAVRGVKRSSK